MTRTFKTEVLLSITTGRLLCDFSDVQEAVEFICGESVWTHQFAHRPFVNEVRRALLAQVPQLDVNADSVTTENYQTFRAEQIARLGAEFSIAPAAQAMRTAAAAFTEPLEKKAGRNG